MSIIPIIIPAYDPDEKLIELMDKLAEANVNQPVYIVDDGSKQERKSIFKAVAEKNICTVLTHAVNMGKGRAIKYAINEALNDYPDLLGCVTIDSDGQHKVGDMLNCMKALEEHPNSLVLGCRDFSSKDVPARSSFGNKTTSRVMKFLVGLSISDTQTGLRAIPREYMKHLLKEKGERYEFETNMLLSTKEYGIDIVEVPIETVYLDDNRSSHFNPLKDSLRIYALFTKFLVSSFSSSLVDLVLFKIFCNAFNQVDFGVFGYIFVATIAARILSATYNFTINYRTVFKSEGSVVKAVLKYAALAIVIMLISGSAVDFIHGVLPIAELAIKIPVDVLLFLASFWIQREFVYK